MTSRVQSLILMRAFFLLYKTHVMKMDPGEKTITLSPVQKVSSGLDIYIYIIHSLGNKY